MQNVSAPPLSFKLSGELFWFFIENHGLANMILPDRWGQLLPIYRLSVVVNTECLCKCLCRLPYRFLYSILPHLNIQVLIYSLLYRFLYWLPLQPIYNALQNRQYHGWLSNRYKTVKIQSLTQITILLPLFLFILSVRGLPL